MQLLRLSKGIGQLFDRAADASGRHIGGVVSNFFGHVLTGTERNPIQDLGHRVQFLAEFGRERAGDPGKNILDFYHVSVEFRLVRADLVSMAEAIKEPVFTCAAFVKARPRRDVRDRHIEIQELLANVFSLFVSEGIACGPHEQIAHLPQHIIDLEHAGFRQAQLVFGVADVVDRHFFAANLVLHLVPDGEERGAVFDARLLLPGGKSKLADGDLSIETVDLVNEIPGCNVGLCAGRIRESDHVADSHDYYPQP